MNYEKRYKEALERMKSWAKGEHPECFSEAQKAAEFIFPELKESEDERIRKEIISHLHHEHVVKRYVSDVEYDRWIAWLEKQGQTFTKKDVDDAYLQGICDTKYEIEKQGEQKTDKIEPKFKVGDWVVTNYGNASRVVSVDNDGDGYTLDNGVYFNGSWCDTYHLWTIQDAKDGDVLVDSYSKDSILILYKGIDKERSVLAHCGWNGYNLFVPSNDGLGYGGLDNTDYLPATKEQRELLFQKIKEAGYEWDAEKKELSKQFLKIIPKFCVGQLITDNNGTWYKITNIKCLDDWYYEVYDVGEDNTRHELCSIIDEKFRENRFVGEIKKMLGN